MSGRRTLVGPLSGAAYHAPMNPSDKSLRPLEPSGEEMRARVDQVLQAIVAHIESLPEQRAGYDGPDREAITSLIEDVPERPGDLTSILELLFGRVALQSFNAASPGYLAYIPGGGLFDAALADFIAGCLNRYTGVWVAAPELVQLEANVVRWLCRAMGMGEASFGILTSGGSTSNLVATVTARRKRFPDEDFRLGVMYAGDQIHHSVTKAARLAGFPDDRIVAVATDAVGRIDVADFERRIDADRRAGRVPFFCVASAATVNTGVVDDLVELADVCQRDDLWFHVDAAYGGFFHVVERGRQALSGIERADSITLDPHKSLFLPYGTGALLVRDRVDLAHAHEVSADYLPDIDDDDPLPVDFCNLSPELSRPYRGLRLWLPIKLHGFDVFREALDEKLDLAHLAARRLEAMEGIELVAPPALSLFAFRLVRPGLDDARIDDLNRRLLDRILASNRVWLSSTVFKGHYWLRICVLSFRTHLDRIEETLDIIEKAIHDV